MNQQIFYYPNHGSQSHQKQINYVFEYTPNNIEFVFNYGQDDKPRFHLNKLNAYANQQLFPSNNSRLLPFTKDNFH